jgi:hypothetical protein
MGLFICAKCNCVENTALGHWWSRNVIHLILPKGMENYEHNAGLCSECLPKEAKFSNGKLMGAKGEWHGKFPKMNYNEWKKTAEGKHYKRLGFYLDYIK